MGSKIIFYFTITFKDDIDIYKQAKDYGNVIIISKDSDLPQIITRLGSPPKLINLKIGNCDNRILWKFIIERIDTAVNLLMRDDINIVELEK